MRISDWSSDVCSSDLSEAARRQRSRWVSGASKSLSLARPRTGASSTMKCGSSTKRRERCWARGRKERSLFAARRSEEHTELQSLMRTSYAVFCLKKKKIHTHLHNTHENRVMSKS